MKGFWLTIGWFSFLLGFIGIFIPLLPTTPFILLAAYAFSRGSPRLHAWLLSHPSLGPKILDWERDGVIRRSAKKQATVLIFLTCLTSFLLLRPRDEWFSLGSLLIFTVILIVLLFIWTRPSERP